MQPDDLLSDVLAVHAGRLVGDGVPAPDVDEAVEVLTRWSEWFDFWRRKAVEYEQLAEHASRNGHNQTAGTLFWYGAMAYHYAQFLWFHDPERREEGQHHKVRLYRKAAPLIVPPAERFEVVIDGMRMPGYVRLPSVGKGPQPAPCVILLGGLESTKEESLLFENLCLTRGIATCTFDGPGQGEFFFRCKLQPDFERYTSAVIDALATHPEIDRTSLAVLGRSLGGYYAVRSAAFDRRLTACLAWGALFDLAHFEQMHELTKRGFAYVAGYSDLSAAAEYFKEAVDLGDIPERLRCPLYILHGPEDHLIPVVQAERLAAAARRAGSVTLDTPSGGNHCCHNFHHIVRPRMADWLATQLRREKAHAR